MVILLALPYIMVRITRHRISGVASVHSSTALTTSANITEVSPSVNAPTPSESGTSIPDQSSDFTQSEVTIMMEHLEDYKSSNRVGRKTLLERVVPRLRRPALSKMEWKKRKHVSLYYYYSWHLLISVTDD